MHGTSKETHLRQGQCAISRLSFTSGSFRDQAVWSKSYFTTLSNIACCFLIKLVLHVWCLVSCVSVWRLEVGATNVGQHSKVLLSLVGGRSHLTPLERYGAHQPTAGKAKYSVTPTVWWVKNGSWHGVGESRSGIEAWETPPTGDNGIWQQNTEIKTHATI